MKKEVSDYFYLMIGAFISSVGINLIASNGVAFGGVSGFAIVLNSLADIPLSVTNFTVNIFLFIAGSRLIGKKFLIRSFYVVMMQSIFLQITDYITNLKLDLIITSVYGGILLGVGVAVVIYFGGSTGGTDMLALIVNHITKASIPATMFMVDACIIILGLYINSINQALYALIIIYLIKKSVEVVSKWLEEQTFSFPFLRFKRKKI